MTLNRSRMPAALLCLSLVAAGCDLMGGGRAVPDPTTDPSAAPSAPEATRRPRRTPGADASQAVAGPVEATPRRTRRPRRDPEASVAPTTSPEPAVPRTPMPPIAGFDQVAGSDGRFTVLLLGSDARGEVIGERTDTMLVATIDPTDGRVAMVSLPRDTVNVPIGDGQVYASPNRINGLLQSFQLTGASREEALRRTTEAIAHAFDVEIDGYVLIGFVGVRRLVDAIGGVDVTLGQALWDRTMKHVSRKGLKLKAGRNHLDGGRALAFARTRHTDGDYQRAARQQQLIPAVIGKVLANGVDSVPALAELALRHMETDIPPSAVPVLVELASRARLGAVKGTVLAPPQYATLVPGSYTIELRLDAVRALFDRVFAPV